MTDNKQNESTNSIRSSKPRYSADNFSHSTNILQFKRNDNETDSENKFMAPDNALLDKKEQEYLKLRQDHSVKFTS